MNYWLDLFTGTTWNEFQKSGASISGFSHRKRNIIQKIQPGDILLCYPSLTEESVRGVLAELAHQQEP